MAMAMKPFKGANVFMSRNLVPPELFDSLHDALKLNGAEVFFCCDPSRAAPNDFHVISSQDHEKFAVLKSKGCNLLGPQCVFSCAKERRAFPKQDFTCCLAMDGVRILASGFEMDERMKIGKLVSAMGGVFQTKASSDISFVIVKNVLAAKYKWALNVLKKPIITVDWLYQCWNEHRLVPQEAFRVLPFCGLTICVTRIPAEGRKEIEKLIAQNGGKYSADLTKKCTHLISDAPEGDKYKVARKWGHINIVTRKWFDQSIARRACLNEESYPVQGGPASSSNPVRACLAAQHGHKIEKGNSEGASSSLAFTSNLQAGATYSGIPDSDLEATLSQNISSAFFDASDFITEAENGAPFMQEKCVPVDSKAEAEDSDIEGNDLYLSDCRILLAGFEATEMRKLVSMVRRGGGSRYISFNEKLTHIVVGNPQETERKDLRGLAASGVIKVVKSIWLEDCDRGKKEVPVSRKHIGYDLLLPSDSMCSNKGAIRGVTTIKQGATSTLPPSTPVDYFPDSGGKSERGILPEKKREGSLQTTNMNGKSSLDIKIQSIGTSLFPNSNSSLFHNVMEKKQPGVFKGKLFRFSSSFPEDRRPEIIQWVNEGGGEVMDDQDNKRKTHFIVESHGVKPRTVDLSSTIVSCHWIRSCLEDGYLPDVTSHILYSPLPCQIPLPGFGTFRFSVSQYEERERHLLRNLCFVLGAKFGEKLTKKATHLLCKFTNGPKYEAACKWGIKSVTSEWIYECVRLNKVVDSDRFCPKEVSAQDREAGSCTVSQYPTQAFRTFSGDYPPSQIPSHHIKNTSSEANASISQSFREEARDPSFHNKKARLFSDDTQKSTVPSVGQKDPLRGTDPHLPDVAAAIEDLLEQTSKIQELNSEGQNESILFSSGRSCLGQDRADVNSPFGLPRHWSNRNEAKGLTCNSTGEGNTSIYDGFSETQTESQVVGYEEDLSGRQMIIDRVRTRSSIA